MTIAVFYLLNLLPLSYNSYHYLYKQKRYTNFLTSAFYVVASALILLRASGYFIYGQKYDKHSR